MPQPQRPPSAKLTIDRPIALVGMMGAGKSTVGRRLATELGLPFHDADHEIEAAAGMSVAELFERHGEESFRRGEADVIRRLLSGPPIVLATGGGALINPATRQLIAEKALSIWLRADLDTLVRRATRRPTRPLLKAGDPRKIIAALLETREPYYSEATITVESQPGGHARTVKAVLDAIKNYRVKEAAP